MSKQINWEAWASYFFFGYPLGNARYLKDEDATEPADLNLPVERVHLGPAAQTISNYECATRQAADVFLHVLERQLQRRADFNPVVFLSGGWDSRAILAGIRKVAPERNVEAYTTTYDGGNNKEQVFAAQVTNCLSVPHTIIELSDNYYQSLSEQALTESAFSTNMHIWMHDFLKKTPLTRNHVNFDGYAGDLIFRGMKQGIDDDQLSPDSDEFFRRFRVQIPSTVLSKPVYNTLEKLARKVLADELAKYPSETRALNFLINNRGARAVGYSIAAQRKYIEVELPFMDKKLLQLATKIDPAIRLNPSFYPDILKKINAKVAALPSTNSPEQEQIGWTEKPIIKHSEANLKFMFDEIGGFAKDFGNAGGIVDWFTLDPAKTVNSKRAQPFLRRHNQTLESVYLYTKWFKHHHNQLAPGNVLSDSFAFDEEITASTKQPFTENFEGIKAKYKSEIEALSSNHKLHFNLSVDVEAFPISDYYASQTAYENEVNKLIFGDFGYGSVLESELLSKEIPCTYFIEGYSPLLNNSGEFSRVISFFNREHTEIGLHCHAFSIDEGIKKHLNLQHDWYRDENKLTEVLRWGKQRIESALPNSQAITSFRSGRLDVYPNMEACIKNAGFSIDSSLMDSVEENYFETRSSIIGNGVFNNGYLTEVPLTSYRIGDKVRGFNFNSTSFEQICHLIYLSIKFKLPCLTMLLHSWSFGKGGQSSLLGKNVQYEPDEHLIEKFRHLVSFVEQVSNTQFSTISETVKATEHQLKDEKCQQANRLNLKPELITVNCEINRGSLIASTHVNQDHLDGIFVYAFYLVVNGEVVDKHLYKADNLTKFDISTYDNSIEIAVRAFIKRESEKKPLIAKTTVVSYSN
ncbi:asparagine synthase-related protein [Alteromonas stellipolaris]|uniref:asparagine synthase (glutamine-hydrolyzing) n=1 Tax=Alteromonas stellipolaris TaxID=233316 RepID=A0AAW7Z500_9ALTE|nr:asparagine synthase-related protein [Alteromonas stellipolaris]MDO6578825.1 asparagine synthase-related protein [Alteromonas stellipolaris]MDP2536455.1 asparagine synthase-related protein [Alteromonas stellipolaris]